MILQHTPIALPWMSMQTYLFVCKYRIILRFLSLSLVEMLMFGLDFEVEAWLKF